MKTKIIITFLTIVCCLNVSFGQNPENKAYDNSNNISGKIYIGDNLLPNGDIFILKNRKSNGYTFRTKKIRNGNFRINNIESNKYLIYVIPELNYEFLNYPKYLPTYFGNTYYWEKAEIYNTEKSNFEINYSLMSFNTPFYGNKKITGKITFSETYNNIRNIPVAIILLDNTLTPMDFRIADKHTGKFYFENLPEGTYYLHPEIPGLKSSDFKIEINEYDKIQNFKITNEKIKTDFSDNNINTSITGNYIQIHLDDNTNSPVICELIDMSGKSIIKNIYNDKNIYLNTEGLAANIYILKIKTYDNNPVKTKKIFIRNY